METTILPGHRLEITAPELSEEANVEVIVVRPEEPKPRRTSMLEFLGSLTLPGDLLQSRQPHNRDAGHVHDRRGLRQERCHRAKRATARGGVRGGPRHQRTDRSPAGVAGGVRRLEPGQRGSPRAGGTVSATK